LRHDKNGSRQYFQAIHYKNRKSEYLKYEGRVTSVGNFSEAIAGILGGLLATITQPSTRLA
jgi:hypothetical protein